MTGTTIDPRHSSSPCSIVVYLNRHLAVSLTVTFNMQHLPSLSLPPFLLFSSPSLSFHRYHYHHQHHHVSSIPFDLIRFNKYFAYFDKLNMHFFSLLYPSTFPLTQTYSLYFWLINFFNFLFSFLLSPSLRMDETTEEFEDTHTTFFTSPFLFFFSSSFLSFFSFLYLSIPIISFRSCHL